MHFVNKMHGKWLNKREDVEERNKNIHIMQIVRKYFTLVDISTEMEFSINKKVQV